MNRRQFLKTTALVGGGLAVGFQLSGCEPPAYPGDAGSGLRVNAFVQVNDAGDIVLQLHKSEMGQGVYTGLATLAAEELGIHPRQLKIEHAVIHPDYRDPTMKVMITGGSSSLKNSMQPVREAAAVVAAILKHAASHTWGISAAKLSLDDGAVVYGERRLSYAELLPLAVTLPVPDIVSLKSASDFQYIGRYDQRLDSPDKVTGRAVFGLDVPHPDASTAVLLRCPHYGGKLRRFDASAALDHRGVEQVFEFDGTVAVVASGYWAARQGANKVVVEWDKGPWEGLSEEDLAQQQRELLDTGDRRTAAERGEQSAVAGEVYQADYRVPYLAHATMEPMNALAEVREEGIEIWTGNQALDLARDAVADATGYAPEQVMIHNTLLGGGFGRRLSADYVVEAARLAQRLAKPVRVVWSREDDIRHDCYRPTALARMTAHLQDGEVTGFHSEVVAPSILRGFLPLVTNSILPAWVPEKLHGFAGAMAAGYDPSATEGIDNAPYQFPYHRSDYILQETPVALGYWRSVGHSQNGFFMESFIDELAQQTQQDPLQFRLDRLAPDSRLRAVLELVAETADWGKPPEGQYQGLALHESFDTPVAQVANVSVQHGQIRVHKVFCALDCGLAVNPDIVTMQMESGIIFGLTAALRGKISFQDGAVQQSNFHDYELLRLFETPEIEVHRVPSQAAPTGVGEPGVPPIAAAVANAVFAATGQRLRSLPLTLNG